ncbi:MAG: RNA polymerase sigma factor [Planctomycetes bacterium]|nr:RNA polymerase sigma factor [Planctomycetota bacterium]
MSQSRAIASLTLDFGLAGVVVEKSQMWILAAMKDYGPAMVHLLWRILGNDDDVCDAYQETFLRIAHLPDLQKPDNVRAYLYRTATNIALSILRGKQIRSRALSHLVRERSMEGRAAVEMELDVQLLCGQLRDAVVRLPEYLSDVIILHDLGELSYPEVAKIIGIRTATVRVYRHRAMTLLASWLRRDNSEDEVCL